MEIIKIKLEENTQLMYCRDIHKFINKDCLHYLLANKYILELFEMNLVEAEVLETSIAAQILHSQTMLLISLMLKPKHAQMFPTKGS